MILSNLRTKDAEDVGVLFHALIRYAKVASEHLDRSIESVGYGNLLALADSAAAEIALQCVVDDADWDGVVWNGRIQDIGSDSLAEALYEPDARVAIAVQKWLRSFD
ncbi:hypothetical protein [Pseudomonas sp. F1002]|uniref:hypothetical protein n=1 Tax=Pseudomonas sp. F1002 TaxID=2738821 RepID=UPI0015A21AD2|nr:hypothetical protein [Pseudomonas sp. F1002]NWB63546.1 hypothetical protein [Pseudomonas sp. F1002]